jgi:hypothetical protein
MESGGHLKAVGARQLLAPEIAGQHSKHPWKFGRTSLKVRNQANTADAWEKQVLEQFAERAASGEQVTELISVARKALDKAYQEMLICLA